MIAHYADAQGAYLGAWDVDPPAGAVEVPVPPADARHVWDGQAWQESPVEVQRARIQANNAAYSAATVAITADYPQLEKDTWPTQDQEAAAWLASPDALTPWIDRAAVERGIDREEYLRRTIVKSRQFKALSSFLTGRRQKYEDQIKTGGDPALDYALTPELLAELQQIAVTGMTASTESLRGQAA